ncbi:MAG: sulfotransferase, partial [Chloroflexota bacterium]
FSAMVEATVWQRLFDGRFADRGYAISVFEAHVEEVKRTVPPETLLICDVSEGWEPLGAVLGVPVPPGDFPHANNRKSTQRLFLLARVAPIIVGAGLAGLLIWLGNRVF